MLEAKESWLDGNERSARGRDFAGGFRMQVLLGLVKPLRLGSEGRVDSSFPALRYRCKGKGCSLGRYFHFQTRCGRQHGGWNLWLYLAGGCKHNLCRAGSGLLRWRLSVISGVAWRLGLQGWRWSILEWRYGLRCIFIRGGARVLPLVFFYGHEFATGGEPAGRGCWP